MERVTVSSLRRGASSSGLLQVVEPPTPLRRCATDDDLFGKAYGFDFDQLDALDEEDDHEAAAVTPPVETVATPGQGPARASGVDPLFDFDELDDTLPASPAASRAPEQPAVPEAEPPKRHRSGRASHSAPAAERSEGLRVAILVNGSRGDIQPLVALALRLSQLRHRVRVMTNADLVDLCTSRGVDAVPVFASWSTVIAQIGGMAGSTKDVAAWACMQRGRKAAAEWLKANPSACRAAEDCLEEFQPHAVVCGSQSSGPAMRFEMGTGVPTIYTFLAKEHVDFAGSFAQVEPARPSFLAWSPSVEAVDTFSYSEHLHQTGAWLIDEFPPQSELANGGSLGALQAFLSRGPPPVVMGWGSMIAEGLPPAAMLGLALRALKTAARRGVILGGWAKLDELGAELVRHRKLDGLGCGGDGHDDASELADFASESVCFMPEAPHSWLLPQCCCAVHHGGAGTTQAVWRAGIPSVITPIFGDQFTAAETLEGLNVGAAFELPLQKLSPPQLASAVQLAEAYEHEAAALGKRLREEDGVRHAAAVLDRFLRSEVQSGRWAEQFHRLHHDPRGAAAAKPQGTYVAPAWGGGHGARAITAATAVAARRERTPRGAEPRKRGSFRAVMRGTA